jgi:hypothetical protein
MLSARSHAPRHGRGRVLDLADLPAVGKDAEAILELTDKIHHLTEVNNKLIDELHIQIEKSSRG